MDVHTVLKIYGGIAEENKICIHFVISTMAFPYYVVLNNGYWTCLLLCEIATVMLLILKGCPHTCKVRNRMENFMMQCQGSFD